LFGVCHVGRPFRVEGKLRVAGLAACGDWSVPAETADTADDPTMFALARAWLSDARLEHASIAAFARLTLELLHLGAPAELVQASQAASLDEIRHAKLCFGLGSRFAGKLVGPGPLDVSGSLGVNYGQPGCVDQYLVEVDLTQALQGETFTVVSDTTLQIAREPPCDDLITMTVFGLKDDCWRVFDRAQFSSTPEGETSGACSSR
jgi:hypothetical protein